MTDATPALPTPDRPATRSTGGALPVQHGRRALLTWARTSDTGLLLVALLIGAGGGAGAVIFRWLIVSFTTLLSGHHDYSAAGRVANPSVPALGAFFVLLTPVVAGLLYGPLVYFFAREARGHGVPEVMYAVAQRGGRIPAKVALVKALASALCIGGGGSVGREGPIVQIGSALGSSIGRVTGLNEERIRVTVACGAAAGIAATFNAPLAGVFFAMELILADFAARSFGMVVLASVTASVVGRAAFGDQPFLALPAFEVSHVWEYAAFAVLGLLAGAAGVLFTGVLYAIEDLCDWVWRGPEWARPAVGGLALGALLLVVPQMYGVGYPVLSRAVDGHYAIPFLLVLLLAKMVATSLTIGIGGSGGVFAPSLFIGAMLGSAFGQGLATAVPSLHGQEGAFALIGMGAVFGGAARAPITAVVIMFELTGEYSIILPLMVAIVLATGLSNILSADTIYTLKLRRRGVDLGRSRPGLEESLRTPIADLMGPVPPPLRDDLPLADAAEQLRTAPDGMLPVVDDDGAYRGVVTATAVADLLTTASGPQRRVGDATDTVPTTRATDPARDAVAILDHSSATAVPVLDDAGGLLVGWVRIPQLLQLLQSPAQG
ncbi:MAG: chloride channel protein [Marmoricola sp.]